MLLCIITILFGIVLTATLALACGWTSVPLIAAVFVGAFLLGLALSLGFLLLMAKRVDRSVPQEENSPFYRRLTDFYVRAIAFFGRVKITVHGMERFHEEIDPRERFLLVCNHVCIIDPVMLLYGFPKSQLAFISKKENDDMPIVGDIMHKLQCQLIDRENDRAALRTIVKCIQMLKEDKASVAVFPEGYCSDDGLLRRFRPGVFKIAQKAQVPIVVCTLHDTLNVLPNIKKLRSSRVELHVTGIVRPEQFEGDTAVDIADRVYRMMADDLGPARVYRTEE